MRILIPTIGSRGDVQPFIALAQGLMHNRHEVTLATHPPMRTLVEAHEVSFAPIGPDIDMAREVAAIRHRARNPTNGLIQSMRYGFSVLTDCHEDILRLCRQNDLVVVPAAIAAGKNEAELAGLPYLSVSLMPWAIAWDDPKRSWYKRLGYGVMDKAISLITTLPLNRLRRKQGLPPVGKEGFTSPRLNLIPVSPAVFPPNPYWQPQHQVVGFWFVEAPGSWQPPDSLLDFLESGTPPVLVSLGAISIGEEQALENARFFVEAIQQSGVRAIVQGWEQGMRLLDLPATIYAAESLPHSWLLPHCIGIVHHGGFGTTSAALRSGLPQLVIPHLADQFYWGQRVHQLGVGLPFIPRPKLTHDGLAAGVRELAADSELQLEATRLGEKIRSEQGVEKAVRLIETTFTQSKGGIR